MIDFRKALDEEVTRNGWANTLETFTTALCDSGLLDGPIGDQIMCVLDDTAVDIQLCEKNAR